MAPDVPVTDGSVDSLLRVVNTLAKEVKDFTPQLLKVFLYVASHNGCKLESIAKGTKVPGPAVTHMTNWLSDGKYKEHKPLGWIVKRPDPLNHRVRVVFLTRQGQRVIDNLKAQLYPEES